MELIVIVICGCIWLVISRIEWFFEQKKRVKEAMAYNPEPIWRGAWATLDALRSAGAMKNKWGILVGTFGKEQIWLNPKPGQFKGILTFGSMGSGKTSAMHINLGANFPESMIIIEATLETAATVAHYRRRYGPVYIVNPMGYGRQYFRGLPEVSVNQMARYWIDSRRLGTFGIRSMQVSQSMVPDTNSRDPFCDGSAQQLVEFATMAESILNPFGVSPGRVAELINDDVFKYFEFAIPKLRGHRNLQALMMRFVGVKDFKSVHEVLQNTQKHVRIFMEPMVAKALSKPMVAFGRCRQKIQTIIVVNPLEAMGALTMLNRFFLECAIAELQSDQFKGPYKVAVLVDEALQYGKSEILAKSMKSLRKFDCFLALGINDYARLAALYGREGAAGFMNDAGLKQFMKVADAEGAQMLSTALGELEIHQMNKSLSQDAEGNKRINVNVSFSQHKRRILEPWEVQQDVHWDTDQICFMDGVARPILCRKQPYYMTALAKKLRRNPYAPR